MAGEKTQQNLETLKDKMYNAPLSKEDLDLVLSSNESIYIIYHNVSGGITFYADNNQDVLLHLNDKGKINKVETSTLKNILQTSEAYSSYIYEMFAKGVYTLINYEELHGAVDNVESQIYAENYANQKSLKHMSNNVFTGFASEGNKNDIQEATLPN